MLNTTICEVVSNSNATLTHSIPYSLHRLLVVCFHSDQVEDVSFPIYFGLNGECKNVSHHERGCSKFGGSGSLFNNTPNHYRVSAPLLNSSHIAMIYFRVKKSVLLGRYT